jgi:hypothetical protein
MTSSLRCVSVAGDANGLPGRAGWQGVAVGGEGSQVPTVDESGLPGFHTSQWFGLWAPKGTPEDVGPKQADQCEGALKKS